MRARGTAITAIATVLGLSGCAGTKTVTERAPEASKAPPAQVSPKPNAPAKVEFNNPAQQPDPNATISCADAPEGHACHAVTATPSDPNTSPQRNCDTNIVANSKTSCGLAENAFYEVYESRDVPEKYRAIMAHSPSTQKDYELDCDHPGRLIACTSSPLGDYIYVSFPQAAIDAYTDQQAVAYSHSHEVGHPGATAASRIEEREASESKPEHSQPESGEGGEDEVGSYSHAGDAEFCSMHECIGDFEGEGGYVVECSDETFSHAGGIQGGCSHHGGER
jgi:hypothetical protein